MKRTVLPLLVALCIAGLGGNVEAVKRPNFVIIFTDDQGYQDLGCYGSPEIATPNLDRMAAEGMRFTSFYAQTICGPSRTALMTASYPLRVAQDKNRCETHPVVHSEEITIAEVLEPFGYNSAAFGKWDLATHSQSKWIPELLPRGQGFDYFFGTPTSNDRVVHLLRNEEVVERNANMATLTRRYTDEAIQFIEENKDNPFFLYLPHTAVHGPLTPGAKFKGKSQDGPYGDWVQEIDWSMGKLFRVLEETGIDDNTLVLFTSDNGSAREKQGSNLPLRGRKGRTDEGGMRVPCIVRWPGKIPAGISSGAITCTMDLLPTMARLAGGKAPSDRVIDGKDIWPILSGKNVDADPRDAFFYYQMDQLQAVRSGDWKLFLAMDSKKRNWGKPEGSTVLKLFNLAKDIHEDNNVASGNPGVVKRLIAFAEEAREDLGDVDRPGKGQRKAGWVDKPSPRLLKK